MSRSRVQIALLVSRLTAGGLEKVAHKTALALAKTGASVTILHQGIAPAEPIKNISFFSLGERRPLSVWNLWAFDRDCRHWLKAHPQTAVLTFDRTRCQTHLRAGNGVHAAYIKRRALESSFLKQFTFSLNPLHRLLIHFERQAFENPSLRKLFVNSTMVREEILEHYQTPPEKIEVVHNGVEWTDWQQPFSDWPKGRRRLLAEFGIPQEAFVLLFVGHGYRRKGLEFLLRGMARMSHEPLYLLVLGKERKIETYSSLASRLGLNPRVRFLGPRSDLLRFYQAADALAIPSLYDPFANVTVEALAMGLYVVTSPYNGGKEVLNPESGTLFPSLTDPDAVAQALRLALHYPKTPERANAIRQSVSHLEESKQLQRLIAPLLET